MRRLVTGTVVSVLVHGMALAFLSTLPVTMPKMTISSPKPIQVSIQQKSIPEPPVEEPEPTPVPTIVPTEVPKPDPKKKEERPTPTPTPEITKKPTPKPTPKPTERPTPKPTQKVEKVNTPQPTATPKKEIEPTPVQEQKIAKNKDQKSEPKQNNKKQNETNTEKEAVPWVKRADYQNNPAPRYPYNARRNGFEGTVILFVKIGINGQPILVRVHNSSGYSDLDKQALEAVEDWQFTPATRDGERIISEVLVPVRFQLR